MVVDLLTCTDWPVWQTVMSVKLGLWPLQVLLQYLTTFRLNVVCTILTVTCWSSTTTMCIYLLVMNTGWVCLWPLQVLWQYLTTFRLNVVCTILTVTCWSSTTMMCIYLLVMSATRLAAVSCWLCCNALRNTDNRKHFQYMDTNHQCQTSNKTASILN